MTYTIAVVIVVIVAFFIGYFMVSKIYEYFKNRDVNGSPRDFDEDRDYDRDHSSFSSYEKERHYADILGLKANITKNEIKQRYNTLVMKYHPDRVQYLGEEFKILAEKRFKEINEAYLFFKKKYNL